MRPRHLWPWWMLGGALGAVARYALGLWLGATPGLIAANVLGAVCLAGLVRCQSRLGGDKYALWGTGFCGSFTSVSAWHALSLVQMQNGEVSGLAGQMGLQLGLSLLLVTLVFSMPRTTSPDA